MAYYGGPFFSPLKSVKIVPSIPPTNLMGNNHCMLFTRYRFQNQYAMSGFRPIQAYMKVFFSFERDGKRV